MTFPCSSSKSGEETQQNHQTHESQPLIPGLPDEIAENCLFYIPYPYQSLVRSVSSSWNKAIKNPLFLQSKHTLSLSRPYLFVLAFEKSTEKLQWQAFDLQSRRWFILPPMPFQYHVCPASFSTASLPLQGKLYVLGGMRSDTESPLQTLIAYNTSTNTWSHETPMRTPRSFFASASIGSKIYAAGGSGVGHEDLISSMECYEPGNNTWSEVSEMPSGLARYDAAVVGKKMYVTEGWTWPFSFSPRGFVYDGENDTWEEMSIGMREGWTGIGVVLDDKLFVISEHGDCRVKFYVAESDTWVYVGGKGFPCEELRRPFTVSSVEGKIYVVASGLNIAVGSVYKDEETSLRIEWEVVEAPKSFQLFSPSCSQIVYG